MLPCSQDTAPINHLSAAFCVLKISAEGKAHHGRCNELGLHVQVHQTLFTRSRYAVSLAHQQLMCALDVMQSEWTVSKLRS